MADPYLVVTHWARPAPSYDRLARSVIPKLIGLDLSAHLTCSVQTHFFADMMDASEWLKKHPETLIQRFVIDFPAGVSLTTTDWGRSEMIIELALGSADSNSIPVSNGREDIYGKVRALAGALASEPGACLVWLTRAPGDVDGVDDAVAAFRAALSEKSSRPLLLDDLSHAGWLFAWPSVPPERRIRTSEKIESVGNYQYVELIDDRPIDLVPGWVKIFS